MLRTAKKITFIGHMIVAYSHDSKNKNKNTNKTHQKQTNTKTQPPKPQINSTWNSTKFFFDNLIENMNCKSGIFGGNMFW